jgi:hypothetical protein
MEELATEHRLFYPLNGIVRVQFLSRKPGGEDSARVDRDHLKRASVSL